VNAVFILWFAALKRYFRSRARMTARSAAALFQAVLARIEGPARAAASASPRLALCASDACLELRDWKTPSPSCPRSSRQTNHV